MTKEYGVSLIRLAAAQIAYLILLYPLAKTKKFVNKIFYLSTPRFEKTNVYNRQNVYRRADTDCACPPCLPKSAADGDRQWREAFILTIDGRWLLRYCPCQSTSHKTISVAAEIALSAAPFPWY